MTSLCQRHLIKCLRTESRHVRQYVATPLKANNYRFLGLFNKHVKYVTLRASNNSVNLNVDRRFSTSTANQSIKMKVPTSNKMKAVLISEYGSSDNLSWGETDMPSVLKDEQVLIQVVATGLNRADILQRKGSYPPPAGASEIMGLEVSGYVVKLGAKASKFNIGDQVLALLPGGAHAQYAVAYESLTMKMPESMTFESAAAIPENWITAFQVDYCVSLGADAGFNYKENPQWLEPLANLEPKGVDIIIDCVGASYFAQNMRSLKTDGYYILYGLLGGAKLDGENLGLVLSKRLNLFGSTLRSRSIEYKSELVSDFEQKVLPKFSEGKFKSVIYKSLAIENVKEAHDVMESNATMGKIVMTVTE